MTVVIPSETIITIHITTYLSLIIIAARIWIRLRFVSIHSQNQIKNNRNAGAAPQSLVMMIGSSMYADDWVALASLVPLLMRLPIIHLSFVYGGTNVPHPEKLSEAERRGRQKGQQLLIASRLLLVTYYWMMKICIAIFYKRLVALRKSYENFANVLMFFLVLLYFPTPLATFLECLPFHRNWQMIPRPPDMCLTALTTVWVQGITDIVTNIALIVFPIPIITQSHLPRAKKLQLIGLFSLGLLIVIITLVRLPIVVIKSVNSQFVRTLWTSIEVLVSTIVANAPPTKGFISGNMVHRNNKSTKNGSGVGSSGLSSGRAAVSNGGSNDIGVVEGIKGGDIRMAAYGGKTKQSRLDDSDEEALNSASSAETANNSVTTLENSHSQREPPRDPGKLTPYAF